MFIYTVRASTLRFFAIICMAAGVFLGLLYLTPADAQIVGASVKLDGADTNDGRRAYLSSLGYETEQMPVESIKIKIPSEFDKIYAGYNEIQKTKGFDLSKYKEKTVERYTYKVTNYKDYEGEVYANVIVYRGKVVGGDICSADAAGFVVGLG